MTTRPVRFASVLVLAGAAVLAACDDDEMTGPDPQASVYVVHGINGTDIGAGEALPVDVSVSGAGCVLEGVEFRDVEGPLTLDPGTYDVEFTNGDQPGVRLRAKQ